MPYLTERSGPDHRPVLLTLDQQNQPYGALESFFWDTSLGEVRAFLTDMSDTCMTTERWPFNNAEKRAELLFYVPKIETFIEAGWMIALQRDKARQRYFRNPLNTLQ